MSNAAKPPVACGDLGFQHACDPVTEPQISVADDTGAKPRRTVATACAHRRCPVDELGLPDWLHFDRAIGAIHRAALDEDSSGDVVPAAGVGEQFAYEKPVFVAIPQMVVRIDNRQSRLDDFLLPLREPCRIGKVTRVGRRIDGRAGGRRGRGLRESAPRRQRRSAQHSRGAGHHRPPRHRLPSKRPVRHCRSSQGSGEANCEPIVLRDDSPDTLPSLRRHHERDVAFRNLGSHHLFDGPVQRVVAPRQPWRPGKEHVRT